MTRKELEWAIRDTQIDLKRIKEGKSDGDLDAKRAKIRGLRRQIWAIKT